MLKKFQCTYPIGVVRLLGVPQHELVPLIQVQLDHFPILSVLLRVLTPFFFLLL